MGYNFLKLDVFSVYKVEAVENQESHSACNQFIMWLPFLKEDVKNAQDFLVLASFFFSL